MHAIATRVSKNTNDLFQNALTYARTERERRQRPIDHPTQMDDRATQAQQAQADAQANARPRFLAPPAALDRIIRYEAHLSRQLTSALHELEACQARRHGLPSPLARLNLSSPDTPSLLPVPT